MDVEGAFLGEGKEYKVFKKYERKEHNKGFWKLVRIAGII